MNAANVYLAQPRLPMWLFFVLGSLNLVKAGHEALQEPVQMSFLFSLAQGVVFLVLTLGFARARHKPSDRYLRADEDGIRITRRMRQDISLPWPAISNISVADSDILIVERTGKHHKVCIGTLPQDHTIDPKAEFRDIVLKHAEENDIVFTYNVS